MNTEADHLQISALSSYLAVPVGSLMPTQGTHPTDDSLFALAGRSGVAWAIEYATALFCWDEELRLETLESLL